MKLTVIQARLLATCLGGCWTSTALGQTAADDGGGTPGQIIVYGQNPNRAVLDGLTAEAEVDDNGIASYGVDTVGDLLDVLLRQASRTAEDPVVLINGQPATGLAEISDLPTEAVSRVQFLAPGAAARLGENPNRRVINVVIRPDHRQITASAGARETTEGGRFLADADLNLLRLSNGNRRSLVFKVARGEALFEAERGIETSSSAAPFDLSGNVLAYPVAAAEIDPALSQIAGQIVTVAGAPEGIAAPALADFAARANRANVTDEGRFRTLLPQSLTFSLNGNLTQKFSNTTNLTVNVTGEFIRNESELGLQGINLTLPPASPFSPFSQPVAVARSLDLALRQTSRQSSFAAQAVLNTRIKSWRTTVSASYQRREARALTDRGIDPAVLQAGVSAGTLSPFGPLPRPALGEAGVDRARSQSDQLSGSVVSTGVLARFPAGPVIGTARLEARAIRSDTQSSIRGQIFERSISRQEWGASFNAVVPVLDQRSALGAASVELKVKARSVNDFGTFGETAYALNWQPFARLTLRASVSNEKIPPPPNNLTDPILAIDGVRTYDFVREETVFVRYITGGNPNLGAERRRTTSLGALLKPFDTFDFGLSADLSMVRGRDVFAALPPANADVQSEFPDRFIRDAAGRLVQVDARLVPFSELRREQLRWGFDLSHIFGASRAAGASAPADRDSFVPGLRVNAFGAHTWALANTRQARPGLPVIDLLNGGAVGYASGIPRHSAQLGSSVAYRGAGLQLDLNWTGSSRITSGASGQLSQIRFAPRTLFNLRAFVNLGPQFPDSPLAKGARVSLEIDNVLQSKQRVADQRGQVPLGYQPFLIDPEGRAVRLSLRKVF